MRRRLRFVAALCCAVLLAGCTAAPPQPEETGPQVRTDYAETHDLTACVYEDAWDERTDYIEDWAHYAYEEFGVTEVAAEYLGGGTAWGGEERYGIGILKDLTVATHDFLLTVTSETPLPDSVADEQGRSLIVASTVSVGEQDIGGLALAGVVIPGRFDKNDSLDAIYALLEQNEQYAPLLLPREAPELPQGTLSAEINQLLPEGVAFFSREVNYLTDGTAVLGCVRPLSAGEGIVGVLFWRGGEARYVETEWHVSLYGYEQDDFWRVSDYLATADLDCWCEARGDHAILTRQEMTDSLWNITRMAEVYPDGTVNDRGEGDFSVEYYGLDHPSPDGSRTVRSVNASIYEVTGEQERLLLEGKSAMKELGYSFVLWLDNDRFLYYLSYGWGSNGYYLYDLRDDSAAEVPIDLRYYGEELCEGRLLLSANPMVQDETMQWTVMAYDFTTDTMEPLPGIPEGWNGNYLKILEDNRLLGAEDTGEGMRFSYYDLATHEVTECITLPISSYTGDITLQHAAWYDYGTYFTPMTLYYLPME